MQATLEIALEHAARHGAGRILRLVLRVGDLSGVVPEALEFAFDVVTTGTMAEGARLEIMRVPLICACTACGSQFQPPDVFFDFDCPQCHGMSARVCQGRELELDYLEVS
jgi:hydrogenase nickel incorporation protein HypA/HybF